MDEVSFLLMTEKNENNSAVGCGLFVVFSFDSFLPIMAWKYGLFDRKLGMQVREIQHE